MLWWCMGDGLRRVPCRLLVLRLSTRFLKQSSQNSLHRNKITSVCSVNLARSFVYLRVLAGHDGGGRGEKAGEGGGEC